MEKIHAKYEAIFKEYGKLVYFIISKYVKDVEDVTDLTYEVFLRFFNMYTKKEIKGNVKAYLVTCSRNISFDYLKRRNEIYDGDINMIEDKTQSKLPYEIIVRELHKILSDKEIDIIIMHAVEEVKFKDIALKYDSPINSVISIYNRALKKVRKDKDLYEKINYR